MADGQFIQRARSFLTEPMFANMAGRTPEDVERRRAMAEQLMTAGRGDGRVESWFEGLGNLVNAWGGRKLTEGIERYDTDQAAQTRALWEQLAGQAYGEGGEGAMLPQPPPAPTAPPPSQTGGSWMLAGSGATGTSAPPEIVYANTGATRNDPLTGQLTNVLQAAAADAGIDRIVVVSGGQEAAGEGGERTGSTRHDHGNAADVELYVGGRLLDFSNPQDMALYQRFVSAAAQRGITGLGAGSDYMGNTRIHVGYGTPAVWGAGGSSANAPEWLRSAYGAGGGATQGDPAQAALIQQLLGNQQTAPLAQQQIISQLFPPTPEPQDLMNVAPGNTVYDPNSNRAVFTAPEQAEAPAAQPRPMNEQERVRWGISPDDRRIWAVGADGQPQVIGGDAPRQQELPFADEEALRDNFRQETGDFRLIEQHYARLQAAAQNPSAAGDVAMIFAFMKMLDPGSVVRESEYATAQNAAGVPEQLRALWNRIVDGERLTENVRADFLAQARGLFDATAGIYDQYVDRYRQQAQSYNLDPDRIAPVRVQPGAAAGAGAGGAAGNDPLGIR